MRSLPTSINLRNAVLKCIVPVWFFAIGVGGALVSAAALAQYSAVDSIADKLHVGRTGLYGVDANDGRVRLGPWFADSALA